MQLYDRGIRRRLAPMLGGDRRRIELAYVLQFSLPGTPVIRYGEEIGMGDDLSLRAAGRDPDPDAVGGRGAGRLHHVRPSRCGRSSPRASSATRRSTCGTSSGDPGSLLSWFERALRVLRECPEFGTGACAVLDTRSEQVLGAALRRPVRVGAGRAQPGRVAVHCGPGRAGRGGGRLPDRRARRPRRTSRRRRTCRRWRWTVAATAGCGCPGRSAPDRRPWEGRPVRRIRA